MAGILKVDQVQSDSNLSFQVAGANVAYMNSTGFNITGGQIIAGSNTLLTASGLIYANAGIAFPATQVSSADANTLDDYEEGTWTPKNSGGTAYTLTEGTNTSGYVKIGQIVFAYCDITITGSTNNVYGLPYASKAVINPGNILVGYNTYTAGPLHGVVANGSTRTDFYYNGASGANFTGHRVQFSVIYQAAA